MHDWPEPFYVFSRFLTTDPCCCKHQLIHLPRFDIEVPLRAEAALTTQRKARLCCRSNGTSIGTCMLHHQHDGFSLQSLAVCFLGHPEQVRLGFLCQVFPPFAQLHHKLSFEPRIFFRLT